LFTQDLKAAANGSGYRIQKIRSQQQRLQNTENPQPTAAATEYRKSAANGSGNRIQKNPMQKSVEWTLTLHLPIPKISMHPFLYLKLTEK